jgi:ABC-type multidrug transport system permease subunit
MNIFGTIKGIIVGSIVYAILIFFPVVPLGHLIGAFVAGFISREKIGGFISGLLVLAGAGFILSSLLGRVRVEFGITTLIYAGVVGLIGGLVGSFLKPKTSLASIKK